MKRDDLLDRLADIGTPALSDALDEFGLPPGVGGLLPLWDGPVVAGRAVTVQLGPRDTDGPVGAHIGTAAVDAAQDGDVIVVANDGRTDVSCWGGLLSLGAQRRGVRGIVADGACRDIDEARRLGLPIHARATVPRTARGRLREVSHGQPVRVTGLLVTRGDLVLADTSGLVVVPAARAAEVLDAAERMRAREAAIVTDLLAGAPLANAMSDARLAGR